MLLEIPAAGGAAPLSWLISNEINKKPRTVPDLGVYKLLLRCPLGLLRNHPLLELTDEVTESQSDRSSGTAHSRKMAMETRQRNYQFSSLTSRKWDPHDRPIKGVDTA